MQKSTLASLVLACIAFVGLGLPDGLIGVGWPFIRNTFHVAIDGLGALLVLATAGYLASSFSTGRLLAIFDIGTLLALSCGLSAASLLGFAITPSWGLMMVFAIIAGLGAGAVDAGLNTFAAKNFSTRAVNWLHAFYGAGAALGPIVMTQSLMANHSWRFAYIIVGAGQVLLAAGFLATKRSWGAPEIEHGGRAEAVSLRSTARVPAVWEGIAMFFVYTGLEAAAGVWSYTMLTEYRSVPMAIAGTWVSVYWGCLTAGRVLSGLVAKKISTKRLLRFCFAGAIAGSFLLWISYTQWLSFAGIALLGLSFAPVFPTMIAATPGRLKLHTANGIGFQMSAAVLGMSLIPATIGVVAKAFTLELLPPILIACLLILVLLNEL